MSEEQRPESGSHVMDELESLSQQLVTAVRALWDSDDSRKLRSEIGEGFVELGRQVDDAIKAAQESEAAKEFREQVRVTMDKARETDVAGTVEQGLVTGLHELNLQLSKLVKSLESSGAVSEQPTAEAGAEGETDPPDSSQSEG